MADSISRASKGTLMHGGLGGLACVAEERIEQGPAAILAADVAGYTRPMADDERSMIGARDSHRESIGGVLLGAPPKSFP